MKALRAGRAGLAIRALSHPWRGRVSRGPAPWTSDDADSGPRRERGTGPLPRGRFRAGRKLSDARVSTCNFRAPWPTLDPTRRVILENDPSRLTTPRLLDRRPQKTRWCTKQRNKTIKNEPDSRVSGLKIHRFYSPDRCRNCKVGCAQVVKITIVCPVYKDLRLGHPFHTGQTFGSSHVCGDYELPQAHMEYM